MYSIDTNARLKHAFLSCREHVHKHRAERRHHPSAYTRGHVALHSIAWIAATAHDPRVHNPVRQLDVYFAVGTDPKN